MSPWWIARRRAGGIRRRAAARVGPRRGLARTAIARCHVVPVLRRFALSRIDQAPADDFRPRGCHHRRKVRARAHEPALNAASLGDVLTPAAPSKIL